MTSKNSDVGVVVGRFQVHRLHPAHEALIDSVYSTHRQTLIVLGLSPVRVTLRNPLDFEARKQMLLERFPKATVLYIRDEPLDEGWSATLDKLLDAYVTPAQSVCLYGGRDSFLAHYKGQHATQALEPESYLSGTELRRDISRSVKASEDFRAGVIWASANGYPKVFPTVDVAVRREWQTLREQPWVGTEPPPNTVQWLLVRKPTERRWRFPGGFVAPTDPSYEAAARREVGEETGASVDGLEYVWSGLVDDWRYRSEADKILTTLFTATFISGPIRPADDVAEAQWFKGAELGAYIVAEHKPLVDALTRTLEV